MRRMNHYRRHYIKITHTLVRKLIGYVGCRS